MKKSGLIAFTLIELLVVITIIGILATGAVTIYTAQLQKARDGTRITALETLKGGIEQFYQDINEYPTKVSFTGVRLYVPVLPIDPKTGQSTNNTSLDYAYNVGPDGNGIQNQIYEVSAGLENSSNVNTKATNSSDGGNDKYRLEMGIILPAPLALSTALSGALASVSWANSGSVIDLGAASPTYCKYATTMAATQCNTDTGVILSIR